MLRFTLKKIFRRYSNANLAFDGLLTPRIKITQEFKSRKEDVDIFRFIHNNDYYNSIITNKASNIDRRDELIGLLNNFRMQLKVKNVKPAQFLHFKIFLNFLGEEEFGKQEGDYDERFIRLYSMLTKHNPDNNFFDSYIMKVLSSKTKLNRIKFMNFLSVVFDHYQFQKREKISKRFIDFLEYTIVQDVRETLSSIELEERNKRKEMMSECIKQIYILNKFKSDSRIIDVILKYILSKNYFDFNLPHFSIFSFLLSQRKTKDKIIEESDFSANLRTVQKVFKISKSAFNSQDKAMQMNLSFQAAVLNMQISTHNYLASVVYFLYSMAELKLTPTKEFENFLKKKFNKFNFVGIKIFGNFPILLNCFQKYPPLDQNGTLEKRVIKYLVLGDQIKDSTFLNNLEFFKFFKGRQKMIISQKEKNVIFDESPEQICYILYKLIFSNLVARRNNIQSQVLIRCLYELSYECELLTKREFFENGFLTKLNSLDVPELKRFKTIDFIKLGYVMKKFYKVNKEANQQFWLKYVDVIQSKNNLIGIEKDRILIILNQIEGDAKSNLKLRIFNLKRKLTKQKSE